MPAAQSTRASRSPKAATVRARLPPIVSPSRGLSDTPDTYDGSASADSGTGPPCNGPGTATPRRGQPAPMVHQGKAGRYLRVAVASCRLCLLAAGVEQVRPVGRAWVLVSQPVDRQRQLQ